MTKESKKFRDILYKLLIVVLTSSVILWLSVFLYVTFYYAYMPAVSHTKPAHLQFRWCENMSMCSFPQAAVPLVRKGQDQLLMRGQQYKVFLDLEMPESPVNQKLGMFMIKIEFLSKNGNVLHSNSRAAMLRYKSQLLQTFGTFFMTPFLLLGSAEEKQVLSIELCDYYEEDSVSPSTSISVEIQSKHIEIYSSQLRIYAHFTGLRYMMFHWPVVSAIIGIGTNLFFLSIVAALSWYRYFVTHESHEVVVRVDFDDNRIKSIEERRNQVRDFLLREKQRQSRIHQSISSCEVTSPTKPVRTKSESINRTHSLDIMSMEEKKGNIGPVVTKKAGPKDVGGDRSRIEETYLVKKRNDSNVGGETNDDDYDYDVDYNYEDDSDSDHIIGDNPAKQRNNKIANDETNSSAYSNTVRTRKGSQKT
ncbi:hypothetical protein CHUAL_009279 [Chamberlinius hualienensis]